MPRSSRLLFALSLSAMVVACGGSDEADGLFQEAAPSASAGGNSTGASGKAGAGAPSSGGATSGDAGASGKAAGGKASGGKSGAQGGAGGKAQAGQGGSSQGGEAGAGKGGSANGGQPATGGSAGGAAGQGMGGAAGGSAGQSVGGQGVGGQGVGGEAAGGQAAGGLSGQAGAGQGGDASAGASGGPGGAGAGGDAGGSAQGGGGAGGSAGAPPLPVCGDGVLGAGEQCDDGNANNDDGCDDKCLVHCPEVDGVTLSPVNYHCYWTRGNSAWADGSWSDMQGKCAENGGHLVTISSDAENAFVRAFTDQEFWIGASEPVDIKDPAAGAYAWVNGELFGYTHWGGGEPNRAKSGCFFDECFEHCAIMRSDGFWNDRRCDEERKAVCEYDPPGQ